MKQLHIPSLGDVLTLAEDWTFTIVNDRRNESIIVWAGETSATNAWYPLGGLPNQPYHPLNRTIIVTLPKGTVLKIDRIYIRKGAKKFDSVTFNVPDMKVITHLRAKRAMRFFASLSDVNNMMVE